MFTLYVWEWLYLTSSYTNQNPRSHPRHLVYHQPTLIHHQVPSILPKYISISSIYIHLKRYHPSPSYHISHLDGDSLWTCILFSTLVLLQSFYLHLQWPFRNKSDHVIDSCLKLLSILKVAYKAKRRLALALHPALWAQTLWAFPQLQEFSTFPLPHCLCTNWSVSPECLSDLSLTVILLGTLFLTL